MIASIAAYVSVGMLLTAGFSHLTGVTAAQTLVARQRVWPSRWILPLTVGIGVLELGLGIAGATSILLLPASQAALTIALLAIAVLFLALSVYSALLLRFRSGVPCACSHVDYENNVWVPLRGLAVSLGAMLAAIEGQAIHWSNAPALDLLFVVLASLSLAILLWHLPEALGDPRGVGERSFRRSMEAVHGR
jgi:hypothetical protein